MDQLFSCADSFRVNEKQLFFKTRFVLLEIVNNLSKAKLWGTRHILILDWHDGLCQKNSGHSPFVFNVDCRWPLSSHFPHHRFIQLNNYINLIGLGVVKVCDSTLEHERTLETMYMIWLALMSALRIRIQDDNLGWRERVFLRLPSITNFYSLPSQFFAHKFKTRPMCLAIFFRQPQRADRRFPGPYLLTLLLLFW